MMHLKRRQILRHRNALCTDEGASFMDHFKACTILPDATEWARPLISIWLHWNINSQSYGGGGCTTGSDSTPHS